MARVTSDLVGALVRIARREETAADATTVLSALHVVERAERERLEQEGASREERRVTRAFAGHDLPLHFQVGSVIAAPTHGRRLDATDAACCLLVGRQLAPDELGPLLAVLDRADAGQLHRQLARSWAELGEPDRARAEVEAMGDLAHMGYRDIGDIHAVGGDAAGFFRLWRTYAASKDRRDMTLRKERLVAAVARHRGWQAALAVCDDKRIGPGLRPSALAALPLAALEDALACVPAGTVGQTERLFLLVDALVADSPDAPLADHPRLPSLLEEIIALDPTSSRDTMRERNWLLLRLWPAYGDQSSIDRAHQAARGPQAKSEIGRQLSRDVRGPET